jgi:hypothetical protein
MAGTAGQVPLGGWAAPCGIPSTSRRGYHARTRGAELVEVESRAVKGCAPEPRVVGLRQVDGMPHSARVVGKFQGQDHRPRLPTGNGRDGHRTARADRKCLASSAARFGSVRHRPEAPTRTL